MRTLSAILLGGALLTAGFFLLVMLSGCAVGYTEPATDGSRAALLGWKLDDVAAAGGRVGGFVTGWLGSAEGIATLTGGGGVLGIIGLLTRAWANRKAEAAAEASARETGDKLYDEGRSVAHASRDRADAAYLEGLAHASSGLPRAGLPVVPAANAGGAA